MSSRHCDFTFPEKMLFVEIVAIHCVLRQKNTKFQCFCVFLTSRVDFQRAGRIFKLMQNRTHHKTTPNSTSERPSGLTVSVTLEDAWFPKQTWGWPPEVAKEQGWQVLPTWGSSVYWLQLAPTWFNQRLKENVRPRLQSVELALCVVLLTKIRQTHSPIGSYICLRTQWFQTENASHVFLISSSSSSSS